MKLVALAVVVVAAAAHADPAPMSAEARVRFDRGTAYYDAGDYAAAIAELQAGRQIEAHPDFLYALGQAYRKQGDCAHAVVQYLAFLDTHPPNAEATRVRANIARCPTLVAPGDPPPVVEPSPVVVTPRSAPLPRETRVPKLHRIFYADAPGDLLAIGGLAGLGVGVTYLVLGERDAQAANSAPTLARLQQLSATSGRERTIGAIGAVAGGALGVAAIVRYVIVARREPAFSIAVQPSGLAAVWSGRF